MKKALISISTLAVGVTAAFAQTVGQVNGGPILQLLALAQTIVNRLVPFAIGVAVLALFYFLIMFIFKGSKDPAEQQKSLKGMAFSVLAIFVMVSIWGIVGLLGNISGIGQGGSIPVPGVPSPCPPGVTSC